jgi:hypothetical protein
MHIQFESPEEFISLYRNFVRNAKARTNYVRFIAQHGVVTAECYETRVDIGRYHALKIGSANIIVPTEDSGIIISAEVLNGLSAYRLGANMGLDIKLDEVDQELELESLGIRSRQRIAVYGAMDDYPELPRGTQLFCEVGTALFNELKGAINLVAAPKSTVRLKVANNRLYAYAYAENGDALGRWFIPVSEAAAWETELSLPMTSFKEALVLTNDQASRAVLTYDPGQEGL